MNLNRNTLLQYGGLTGFAIFYLSIVGMVEAFNERDIIKDLYQFGDVELLTLGQILILVPVVVGGYVIGRKVFSESGTTGALLSGLSLIHI